MKDCSPPQLLLWQFPLGLWSNVSLFILGVRYKMQIKSSRTKKPHQLWVKGADTQLDAVSLCIKREKPSYSVCMSSCCRGNEEKKNNIWHDRRLVNNLQGHTEHVQPSKTTPLQALRLHFSARAWPEPCFVLLGLCYRHQGEDGSQDTRRAAQKWIKLLGKSAVLEGRMEY